MTDVPTGITLLSIVTTRPEEYELIDPDGQKFMGQRDGSWKYVGITSK